MYSKMVSVQLSMVGLQAFKYEINRTYPNSKIQKIHNVIYRIQCFQYVPRLNNKAIEIYKFRK